MKKYILIAIPLLLSSFLFAANSVVISQILYDSPLNEVVTTPPYSNGEFVELYNLSGENVDLSNWTLIGDGVTEKYVFPMGTTISGGGHLIVAYRHKKDPNFELSSMYSVNNTPIVYQNKVVLKNAGEAIRLYDLQGILIDSIYFDGTSHKTKPDRLYAENADSISGNLCKSLQRTKVTYDSYGYAIASNTNWEAQYASLGTIIPSVHLHITDSFYWEQGDDISVGSNYIICVKPLDKCSNLSIGNNGNLSLPEGCRAQVSILHIDEFGKAIQTTYKSASPTGEDLISYTEYNHNTHSINTWLPIVADGTNLLPLSDIQNLATSQYNDAAPYATTSKELLRDGRVMTSSIAGETYQNHASHIEYKVNEVAIPYVVVNHNGFSVDGEYPVGSLRSTTIIDADGKKQTKFVNMNEQTIIARLGDDLDTYYVYDDFGQLCYVLPPAITTQLNGNSSFSDNDELIRNYAYVYKYDKRGNQIYKRFPGAEHICMIYDKAGRLALTQDGNQRERGNIWLMTKYDEYGRNIYSLECDMQAWNYEMLLDSISNLHFTEKYSLTTTMLGNTGYTNTKFAMPNSKILVVNYYDNYDFLNLLPIEIANMLRYKHAEGYAQQYENSTGLATGCISYNLTDELYTISTNYYDIHGHIIQVRNSSLHGGYQVAHTAYNFDGTKSKQILEHNNDIITQREKYTYSYDHVGRPIVTKYQLNDAPAIMHTQLLYNPRGQLIKTLRHNKQDTIKYQYITNGALIALSNKHFSEKLFYADSLPDYATAYYNGNISAMDIKFSDSTYHFTYDYDDYNRLQESFYLKDDILHSNEYFDLDIMGNIKRIQRYTLQGQQLDDLSFILDGNKIKAIEDYASATDLYTTKEYYDRCTNNDTPEMDYDANGNLTRDLDRTIDTIKYNIYNLPDTVIFANGNKIINHYNASGNKWKTEYHTIIDAMYLPNTTDGTIFEGNLIDIHYTIYDGNIEYKYIVNSMGVDSLYEYVIHNAEGYIAYHPQNNTMTHYYYHQDHLGNICAVWDATHDSIVQQTLYYASGLPVSVSTGQDVQPYKYNGKEFVEMHGYDVYEYGARGYYATIGRFTSIDPLCEQTPWQSPYVYANNNWVNNIDWMGMSADGFHVPTLNWVAIDKDGKVQGFDLLNDDKHVYLVDDSWDGTYEDLSPDDIIGWQIPEWTDYIIGKPCYYLGSITKVIYLGDQITVIGSTALMYGKSSVTLSVDDSVEAFFWYYIGFGRDIALGDYFTRQYLMLHSDFNRKYNEIINAPMPSSGQFSINMTEFIFHIGKTSINYYTTNNYSVFSIGIGDAYCDVLYWFEKSEDNPDGITPDGKGWLLEVGIPYSYIPTAVLIPHQY